MLDTPLNGVLFICGTMILSVVGLLIVRRFADLEWLKRHHEVASFFFLMIGTLYAVLVAFAIFVVWTQFQDAGTNLEQEANAVADLSRMSLAMPEPLRSNIRSALLNYVNAVLQDEFPAMAEGRNSPRTWEAMQKLWTVYDDAEPNGIKGQVYFSESIKRLNDLSNYRRVRLFTSRGTVPTLLWYLLFIGGILLVGFTYLFGHESLLSQAAMTAAMTGVLAFSLFLIIAYDSPFGGAARVSETPFQVELEHVNLRH